MAVRRRMIVGFFTLLAYALVGMSMTILVAWGTACVPWSKVEDRPEVPSESSLQAWRESRTVTFPEEPDAEMRQRFPGGCRVKIVASDAGFDNWFVIRTMHGLPLIALERRTTSDLSQKKALITELWATPATAAFGWNLPPLPLRPIWPGFAINSVGLGCAIWAAAAAWRFCRRRLRLARGLCPACAYPMGIAAVCSECGGPLPPGRMAEPSKLPD